MTARVLATTAAALVIGNELLTGKIHESNLVQLARTLRSLGVTLRRVAMVPDEIDVIAEELRRLATEHDLVVTSGGVGPTHDDVTLDAVARAFGVATRYDAEIEKMLRRAYGERFSEGHRRMALVPEGAELLSSEEVRWPTVIMRNVWVLPGVPEAFRMKLALIREHIRGPTRFVSRAVFTKMDEGELKPLLDEVVDSHPAVEVGSYPKWFDSTYKTKVTFDAQDEVTLDRALQDFLSLLPDGEPQRVE